MKTRLFFVILLLIYCQSSSAQTLSDSTFAFQFNAKTFVEVYCPTCESDYSIKYRSSLLSSWAKFDFKKGNDNVYRAEVMVDFPQQVRFFATNPTETCINLLTLIPNDTLKIAVKYDDKTQKHSIVKILAAQYPEITQYNMDKVRDLEYYETDLALSDITKDKREDFLWAEINYLEKYHQKTPLPAWFVAMEKNNLLYYWINSWKSYRPIENHHALNSKNYMHFLDDYVKIGAGLLDSTTIKDAIKYKRCLPFVSKDIIGDMQKRTSYASTHLKSDINDFYTLFLISYLTSIPPTKKPLYEIFDVEKIKNENIRKYAKEKIEKYEASISPEMREKPLAEFLVLDEKNELIVLNEHFKNTTYLSFWFPACSPCIKAVPDKNKLVENMSKEDFDLVNICVAGSEEEWKIAIEKYKMKGKHFYVKHTEVEKLIQEVFGTISYPHYSVVQDGKLVVQIAEKPNTIQKYLETLQKK